MYVHCVSPAVIKYSLVFDTKHKILPKNTCGVVQTFYSNVSRPIVVTFKNVSDNPKLIALQSDKHDSIFLTSITPSSHSESKIGG